MFKVNLHGLTKWEEYITQNLLDDFIDLMGKDLSGIELTIQNIPANSYPMTAPKRLNPGQKEDFIIYLNHKPEYWCQMIYQLAHELGHFFMDCYPKKDNLRWIDECLCELFSIIFLSRSISFFETFSPTYVQSVRNYISDYLQSAKSYTNVSCQELINQKMNELENDPTEDGVGGRPRNNYIAAMLYDALGSKGKGLSAVCLFPKLNSAPSCKEFFDLWIQHCRPNEERSFVITIMEHFGMRIKVKDSI